MNERELLAYELVKEFSIEGGPGMSELTEFLLARIEEDESRASSGWSRLGDTRWETDNYGRDFLTPYAALAECSAKRAVIEQAQDATDLDKYATDDWPEPRNLATQPYCGDVILRALAAVYKDHPGYRQEWANG